MFKKTKIYQAMFLSRRVLLPMLLGVSFATGVYADANLKSPTDEHINEAQGIVNSDNAHKKQRNNWNANRLNKINQDKAKSQELLQQWQQYELQQRQNTKLVIPPPGQNHSDARDHLKIDWISVLGSVADLLLPAKAEAATTYGNITIDGSLSDWTSVNRINWPANQPPYLATGTALYGKYVAGSPSMYVFALSVPGTAIGSNTTVWMNADQNQATGFNPWAGANVGAEYFMNVYTDGSPNLYNAAGAWLSALTYAYSSDKTILEFAVPATSLVGASANGINVVGDISDSLYFPSSYATNPQFTVPTTVAALPTRTDKSKGVGIVFSTPSKNFFYNEKAYSQLYMSIQHQAMMAGIRFDLLTENDLTNLSKLVNYDALIFPYAANLSSSVKSAASQALYTAIYQFGLGIIAADGLFTNDETNAAFAGDSYQLMEQLLGITRVDGGGPVAISVLANAVTHPAMRGYAANESILSSNESITSTVNGKTIPTLSAYKEMWTSFYAPIAGQAAEHDHFGKPNNFTCPN